MRISEVEAQRIAEEWIDAWNRHDLDAILDHYADDIVSVSPLAIERLGVPDGAVRGKDQLRDYFSRGIAPGSTLQFTLQRVLLGADGMAIITIRAEISPRRSTTFRSGRDDRLSGLVDLCPIGNANFVTAPRASRRR